MVLKTTYGLLVFFLAFVLVVSIASCIRYFRRRRPSKPSSLPRCLCGYPLVGLDLPRCPECGRLVGFNQTAAELGISEESMRAHAAQKREPTKKLRS